MNFNNHAVYHIFLSLSFSYKVVMSLSDPVGDSVRLTDLRPHTLYYLSLRAKDYQRPRNNATGSASSASSATTAVVIANLNFSTAGGRAGEQKRGPMIFANRQCRGKCIKVFVLKKNRLAVLVNISYSWFQKSETGYQRGKNIFLLLLRHHFSALSDLFVFLSLCTPSSYLPPLVLCIARFAVRQEGRY